MKNYRALYQLIQALSPAEKKYIRQRAQAKEAPSYLKLFDALSSTRKYDKNQEKELLQTVTNAENLAEIKKYLYNFILKMLRNFHADKSYRIKLQEYRTNIHLLTEKGLWSQALKFIRKARKLAQEAGFGMDELTFSLLERRIIIQYNDKVSRLLSKNQQECEARAAQLVKEINVLSVYEDVFQAVRSGDTSSFSLHTLLTRLNSIIGSDHEQYLAAASFDAKIQYYYILSTAYRTEKDYNTTNKYLKEMLGLFKSNASYLQETEHQERYIRVLNNYFNNCYYAKTLEENFPDIIEKIKLFPEKNHRLRAEKFQNEYYIKVFYYLQKKDYEEVIRIAPQVEEGLNAYRGNILINRRLTLEYNLSLAYFLTKDYDNAWDRFNAIINDKTYESRKETRRMTEALRLIIFFEKQEFRLLRSFAHSFIDNYGNKEKLVELELVKCLYRIADIMEEKTIAERDIPEMIKTELTALYIQIQQLQQHEEIVTWVQEKIESLDKTGEFRRSSL